MAARLQPLLHQVLGVVEIFSHQPMAPGASEKLAMGTLTTDAATSPTTEAPMTLQVNLGHSEQSKRSVDQLISPLEDPRGSKSCSSAAEAWIQAECDCGLKRPAQGALHLCIWRKMLPRGPRHTSTSNRFFMNSWQQKNLARGESCESLAPINS